MRGSEGKLCFSEKGRITFGKTVKAIVKEEND